MLIIALLLCLLTLSVPVAYASSGMEGDSLRHIEWIKIATKTAPIVNAGTNFKAAGDTFLIIGANTGIASNDPMRKALQAQKDSTYSIFVEPIPPLFQQLKQNLKGKGLARATCVNAAISNSSQPLTLYCTGLDDQGKVLAKLGFSPWCVQTCTSNQTNLLNSDLNTPALVQQYMREYAVPGMTVQELLHTHAEGRKIRAIQIDVEGLDDMVVHNLPLHEISPSIIIFEAIHLSKQKLKSSLKYLHSHDYYTTRYGQNALAFKLSILPAIPAGVRGSWTKMMLDKQGGGIKPFKP